jgi:HEAT repeat protein
MIYFCPSCWTKLERDYERCPSCGCDIEKLSQSQDYVDKLIAALNHPEPETPIRTAWILGQLREKRAIRPLYDIACKTNDTFLRIASINALLEIGTDDAINLANRCLQNNSEIERRLITDGLRSVDNSERKDHDDGNQ